MSGKAARRSVLQHVRTWRRSQVEKTPNPFSLKFLPSQPVLGSEHKDKSGFHFHRGDKEYLRSPLARKLFQIDDVTGIFVANEFVTVSKNEDGAWAAIKPEVFSHIMDFYAEGGKAVEDEVAANTDTLITDDDSEGDRENGDEPLDKRRVCVRKRAPH